MIPRKKKLCLGPCGQAKYIFSNGFCLDCYKRRSKVEKKNRPRIQPLSIKRKLQNAEYLKLRLDFLNLNQKCEALLSDCTAYATDVHHKKGRTGRLLIDTRYWKAVCRSCHRWIEEHPIEAKEKGFSLDRL